MTDLGSVMREHRSNMGFVEGLNNANPWGPEQGVKNAAYCDSAASIVPYHHGLRWWNHCQMKEKGCAYTVYHVNAALREKQYIYDRASQGQPAPLAIGDLVFFDWTNNGGVDHVETVSELPQGPIGNQYITDGYNTGSPNGAHRQLRDRRYLHGVIKMGWAYIANPTPVPPASPVPQGDTLRLGSRLSRGQHIRSPNGHVFVMQHDGNAVVYGGGRALWSTKTSSGEFFILQMDQNLVLYTGARALWSPNVSNRGGTRLVMQDDGNLVLYTNSNRALWASKQGIIR